MLTRKIQFKIFALLWLTFSTQIFAQTSFKKIEIYGNKNITASEINETIAELIKSESSNTNERIEKIKERILNLYIENGFYFARIDSVKIEDKKLKIFITEGKKIRIGSVEIQGNAILSDNEIKSIINPKPGEFFSPKILGERINKLLDRYANIGYPLAKVEIGNLEFVNNDFVNFTLNISEGKLIRIDRIEIQGNNTTKENLILREIRIKRGEIYRDEKFKQIKKRLMKIGLFEFVDEPQIFFNDTVSGVLIKVKEGRMNSFDGIIGYVPEVNSSRGYLTGYINITLKNLFGTGRRFDVRWHSETKETQEFELRYFEPHIFNFLAGAEFSFHQRKQDSIYVLRRPKLNFEIELTGSEKVSEIFKIFLHLSQTSIIPTATEVINYQIFESKTLNIGAGILYDSRDEIIFPKSGVYFSSSYEIGNKKITGPAKLITEQMKTNIQVTKLQFSLDFYHHFEKILNSVFASKFNAIIVAGDGIDESDVFRFGGTRTLRGYREKEFLATRAMWANFENRFKVSEDLVIFGFADVGYIYHPVILPRIVNSFSAIRAGYGLGFIIWTKIGRLNLTYALGKGDSFKTGKIHIGLESEF